MIIITNELLKKYPRKPSESDKDYVKRVSNIRKSAKYNRLNTTTRSFKLNLKYDTDIIKWLSELAETFSSYMKRLIREDKDRCLNDLITINFNSHDDKEIRDWLKKQDIPPSSYVRMLIEKDMNK